MLHATGRADRHPALRHHDHHQLGVHRDRLRAFPTTRVILLGGEQQPDSHVLVGPMVELCAQQFLVDRLFIGTDGFTPDHGFTARDYLRATAVRALAERAEEVVVVTESDKFGGHGPVPLLPASAVSTVWTDSAGDPAQLTALTESGVQVVTVSPSGATTTHSAAAIHAGAGTREEE
nr:DeoR/GlpR family DNA-binding transcription regulator [Actinomyces ruminis]